MIRLAGFLPPGDMRPRLGAAVDGGLLDRAAAHGPSWTMRAVQALPEAALRAFSGRGRVLAPASEAHLLPPIPNPGKFFCVGKNGRVHREELVAHGMLKHDPQEPTGLPKLNEVLVGDGARVVRPDGISTLDDDPEIAFIVARACRGVRRTAALAMMGGITVLNDLTACQIQKQEVVSGTKSCTSKNRPGSCPVGPCVVPVCEVADP